MRSKPFVRLVFVVFFFCSTSFLIGCGSNDQGFQLPIVMNVLKGTTIGVTPQMPQGRAFGESDAEMLLKETSDIFVAAGVPVSLTLEKFSGDVQIGAPGQTSTQESEIEGQAEFDQAQQLGLSELMPLRGKGMKVYVGGSVPGGWSGTPLVTPPFSRPGWSKHYDNLNGTPGPVDPIVLVSTLDPNGDRGKGTLEFIAIVLAHELAHALCLGANHKLEPCTTPSPKRASGSGHNNCNNCNLMAPGGGPNRGKTTPRGIRLTPTQVTGVGGGLTERAKSPRRGGTTPSVPRRQNMVVDPSGDVNCGALDIIWSNFRETEEDEIVLDLALQGFLPETGCRSLEFEWVFDTDNSIATGVTVGPYSGIDRRVLISLVGDYPYDSPKDTISSIVFDPISASNTPVSGAYVGRFEAINDVYDYTNDLDLSSADPSNDYVGIRVPVGFLSPFASSVPMGVIAREIAAGKEDTTIQATIVLPESGPLVTLTPQVGLPGEIIQIAGEDFTPSSTIEVFLGNDPAASPAFTTISNTSGEISASFAVPSGGDDLLFVTAKDPSGFSDFGTILVYDPRRGNVNYFGSNVVDPDNITDVLLINNSVGVLPTRTLTVDKDDPFEIKIVPPPSIGPAGPAKFAFYVWNQAPDPTTRKVLPDGLGVSCLPTPISGGCTPQPAKIANNTGIVELGTEDWPGGSSPAPWCYSLPDGLGVTGSFFFQAIIKDTASAQGKFAMSNGILVISQ